MLLVKHSQQSCSPKLVLSHKKTSDMSCSSEAHMCKYNEIHYTHKTVLHVQCKSLDKTSLYLLAGLRHQPTMSSSADAKIPLPTTTKYRIISYNTLFTRSKYYLDHDPEDVSVYMGHSLFFTTKRITCCSLFDHSVISRFKSLDCDPD